MKYIYHHLGLGDHIICNGLVRCLIKKEEEYIMFVKEHNLTTVKFMYRDLKNLSFLVGDDEFASNFIKENNLTHNDLIIAGFYTHPNAEEFDDGFYLQNNIDFNSRWSNFKCERDYESEKTIFNKFGVKEGEYVFIHDDKSRGYEIDESYVINKDLPIISPVIGYTKNCFDYCYLMQHSKESHFIDSSFKLIFDSLKLRNSNLFYHINLKNGTIKDTITKSHSILNFKII
jgi:hypothetical protein